MKSSVASIVLPTILMLAPGCRDRIDLGREQAALLATDAAFAAKSLEVGAPEAFHLYFADDAAQFPSGANPRFGRDSIYAGMKRSRIPYVLRWTPRKAEVAAAGDLGYTWGTSSVSWKDEKDSTHAEYGKYVSVWKRQADGTWRVILDIGNDNPPPVEAQGG